MRIWPALPLLLAAAFAAGGGCGGEPPEVGEDPSRVEGVSYIGMGEPEGLDRYIRWSDRVGQGAQPEGDAAFRNLAALGYKTVLSVDGAIPDVERAEKYGLRYIHVPIGYDGMSREEALKIVKAARVSDGPIFVHCHHGTHRGPAAAMLCRINEDGVSPDEAVGGLRVSGTSPNYPGLWKAVREFERPSSNELGSVSADLPTKVLPKGVLAGMVDMNNRWTNLKHALKADWEVPPKHPDISPPHEARMLWELFREMARNDPESKAHGDVFIEYLKASEREVIALEKALRAGNKAEATKRYKATLQLCTDCHRDYRN